MQDAIKTPQTTEVDEYEDDLQKYFSPLNLKLERVESALNKVHLWWLLRQLNALWLAPIMRVTGFRFSKLYRWGATPAYRIVYILVDTVKANIRADNLNDPS